MALIGHIREPYSMVYAHIGEGLYQSAIGQAKATIEAFEAAHHITQQADIVLPIATSWLGAAYVQGGRPREALTLLLEAERKGAYRFGGLYNSIHHYMALAQAHLAVGALPSAQAAIGRAQEIAERPASLPTWLRFSGCAARSKRPIPPPTRAPPAPAINAPSISPAARLCGP